MKKFLSSTKERIWQMEQCKERYKKRLAHCESQRLHDKANSFYWSLAAQTYEHLIECNMSHTLKNDGREKCPWQVTLNIQN